MTSGEQFGPYETLSLLGQGGMGEVWKAVDMRLQRTVALKILKSEYTARLGEEARAIAALSNPHICTLHDIRVEGGTPFLVMEYLEGKPFRGPLPAHTAIERALEVLDGLQAAHSIGIVHLDLKPANILITKSGAKLLDFGLARRDGMVVRQPDGSQTLTLAQVNTVAGTPAYMAPEQLEGKDLDRRADIFGFGCVLYEALTGKPAFAGESVASVISAVLTSEPKPMKELAPEAPEGLEWIIRRCLAKDREERWQSAGDLKAVLERFSELSAQQERVARRSLPRWGWAALGVTVAGFLAAGAWWIGRRAGAAAPVHTAHTAIEVAGGESAPLSPSWSPDGKWLVYSAFRDGSFDLWKRPVEGGMEAMVTGTPGNEVSPAWSPKGNLIAFSTSLDGGGISVVHPDGGAPTPLTKYGSNPSWSPDGTKLVFDWQGAVYAVEASGGEPRQVLPGTSGRTYAIWAANGRDLFIWHRAKSDVFRVGPNGELTPLKLVPPGEEVNGLSLSDNGEWLYLSRGAFGGSKDLWRIPMNPATGMPDGAATALTLPLTDNRECQVSPDGRQLAFSVHRTKRHLWLYPLNESTGRIAGPGRQLTFRGQRNYYPALSPDERTVVYTSQDSDMGLLYFQNLEDRQEHKLTQEWGRDNREVLASYSSAGVVYASTLQHAFELYRMPALGGVGLRITRNRAEHRDTWPDWSHDGKSVVYQSNRAGNMDVWITKPDGTGNQRLTTGPANESFPVFSPGGRLIAYVTDKDLNTDVWVRDPAGKEDRPLVQHPAADGPGDWSVDGKRFYFLSDRGGTTGVWMTPAEGGEAISVLARPAPLSFPETISYGKFAVGKRDLVIPLESRETSIFVLKGLETARVAR